MREVLKRLQTDYMSALEVRETNKLSETSLAYLEGRIATIRHYFDTILSNVEASNITVAKLTTPNGEEFLVAHNWRVIKSDIEGIEVGSLIGTSRLVDLVEKLDSTLIINNKKTDIDTWVG